MPWLTKEQVWQKLSEFRADHQKNYFGFYSSRLGGFSNDLSAMMIPLDDHMVHRGDGIFEAFRVFDGAIIDLNAHLRRLRESAEAVGMKLKWSDDEIRDLCLELVQLCGKKEALVRLFVSRGEGSFTTNPKECLGPELYIVLTAFKNPPGDWYEKGVSVVSSKHVWKDSPFAQIKSCNYLLNVFLKQEANEAGAQFAAGFDATGFLTESSTENVIIIDKDKTIFVPEWSQILKGTTLLWVLELARAAGLRVEQRKISREMIRAAREAAIVGTTWGVLPIAKWDGVLVGGSFAGDIQNSVCQKLRALLTEAMKTDANRRTHFPL